jgi:hypothetical protein
MITAQMAGQGLNNVLQRLLVSRHQAIKNKAAGTINLGCTMATTGKRFRGITAANKTPPTNKSKNHLLIKRSFMIRPFPRNAGLYRALIGNEMSG